MDKVFEEEQRHLRETVRKIDAMAAEARAEQAQAKRAFDTFSVVDYDDMDQYHYLKRQASANDEKLQKFAQLKADPYFGRMDLGIGLGLWETFYVGKTGLSDHGDELIIDWRSPVGQFYYLESERRFRHDGSDYDLMLRRSLLLKDGILKSYKTTYDRHDKATAAASVVDPFLIAVLKEKRLARQATDIISSIQENQNKIIRLPLKSSFAVQGCAGSGKTMILLHRLSYLLFNNRGLNTAGIKIITPNENFNTYINELSEELELHAIDKLPIERYYVELIGRFGSGFPASGHIYEEDALGERFLNAVYSKEYRERFIESYHSFWDKALGAISELPTFGAHPQYPELKKHNLSGLEMFSDTIRRMINESQSASEDEAKEAERLHKLEHSLADNNAEVERLVSALTAESEVVASALTKAIDRASENASKLRAERDAVMLKIEALNLDAIKNRDSLRTRADAYHGARQNSAQYSDPDLIDTLSDALAESIRNACAEELAKLRSAIELESKVPFYNFVKRARARDAVAAATAAYTDKSGGMVRAYLEAEEASIKELEAMSEVASELEKAEARLKEIDRQLEDADRTQRVYGFVREMFTGGGIPDPGKLTEGQSRMCAPLMNRYSSAYEALKKAQKGVRDKTDQIGRLERQVSELRSHILPEQALWEAELALEALEPLDPNRIYAKFLMPELDRLYTEHKVKGNTRLYRHKLYLTLLLCRLYCRNLPRIDTMLNIDEAQDVSPAEYKLLHEVHRGQCAFDLYGDVNQLLHEQRGVYDWDLLSDIIGDSMFVLNENYRNTRQITEFCNETFGSMVTAIGVNGQKVVHTNHASAFAMAKQFRVKDARNRVAVIYECGQKADAEAAVQQYGDASFHFGASAPGSVSVLSVKEAKGLEFDFVAVLDREMSYNQKYIAYTRALDNLVVVSESV